ARKRVYPRTVFAGLDTAHHSLSDAHPGREFSLGHPPLVASSDERIDDREPRAEAFILLLHLGMIAAKLFEEFLCPSCHCCLPSGGRDQLRGRDFHSSARRSARAS